MQIVIEIPEEDYINIKNAINGLIENGCERASMSQVCLAILNGTPLPERHGKLKDADELYSIFKENCNAYNIDNLSFISDMDMNFDLAPTIIEGSDNND